MHAVEVTRDVAMPLGNVPGPPDRKRDLADVATFLVRFFLTMFKEHVALRPTTSFEALLLESHPAQQRFFAAACGALVDHGRRRLRRRLSKAR